MRKYTMPDGKTRAASQGPWIAAGDIDAFAAFIESTGRQVRQHPDPFKKAKQVHHDGHWMDVVWNKSFSRYTADRRLSLLVQSFAASRKD